MLIETEMMVSVFDEMALCTDDEVERMAIRVPEWRRLQAMKFKHTFGRFACLKAYLMLGELVGKDISEWSFGYTDKGKPYFKDYGGIYFNISHCRNAIAVCVDDKPVGIDVESFHEANEALVRKTMNEREINEIAAAEDAAVAFTSLWTKKEAVLKLRGTGIIDDLAGVLTGSEITETHINHRKEYVYSFAYE